MSGSVFLATWSPEYQKCQREESQKPYTSNADGADSGVIEFRLGILTYCEGVFADENSGAITAIATILLTVVTGLLGYLAWDQGRTSRAQLRAYIQVALQGPPSIDSNRVLRAPLAVQNIGQTPAFDATIISNIGMVGWPPEKPVSEIFKDSAASNVTRITIGSKNQPINIPELADVSEFEESGIKSGKVRVVVWGRVEYFDAVRVHHITNFAYSIAWERGNFTAPYYEDGFNWST